MENRRPLCHIFATAATHQEQLLKDRLRYAWFSDGIKLQKKCEIGLRARRRVENLYAFHSRSCTCNREGNEKL
jgi:hypothetical protein